MQAAVRRCWRDLAKVMLRHPPRPRTVVNAVGLVRHRHSGTGPDIAEILSLGIRPRNRRRGLGRDLVRHTCERLGEVPVQALVDETNVASRRMFDELGWSVTSRVTAGWPVPQEVFTRVPS
jgi:ribosomal protein S18 acetylase RimI-like enzyme